MNWITIQNGYIFFRQTKDFVKLKKKINNLSLLIFGLAEKTLILKFKIYKLFEIQQLISLSENTCYYYNNYNNK